jgi:DNA-binding NtrC family response regulator
MSGLENERTRSLVVSDVSGDAPRVVIVWDGGTIVRPLEPGQSIVVGRAAECDVQVLDPAISRRHVRVHGGPPVLLEDLGSANGVRVDGEVLIAASRPIAPGQVVEIGTAMMFLQGRSQAPAQGREAPAPSAPARVGRLDFDRFVNLIARSHLTVLILGETGAGKEVMAERIHRTSPRASGPFVRLNCAAFPEALLESELFGHEKGAFTGAMQAKPGLVETADRGTLLLDEVGEMPPNTQAALLRVLETREVRRVGSVQPFAVDVRILSATNSDLEARVAEGRFRRDLLYRLNGVTIVVPPLRERRGQITALARELLARAAQAAGTNTPSLTPAAEATLLAHAWPGNVRELRNVIERALVVSEGGAIDAHHLLLGESATPVKAASLGEKLSDYEREQIVQALATTKGNQTQAAALLGMSRRALINRIEAYGLPRPRKPG